MIVLQLLAKLGCLVGLPDWSCLQPCLWMAKILPSSVAENFGSGWGVPIWNSRPHNTKTHLEELTGSEHQRTNHKTQTENGSSKMPGLCKIQNAKIFEDDSCFELEKFKTGAQSQEKTTNKESAC